MGKQVYTRPLLSQHQAISGAVAGDSTLQDRGVAHYLLSLLFSLVSLFFSFYFCVPYQKYQKYQLPCLLMLSLPWVLKHPNMVGWTCFTWIVFDQFVLALKTQLTWLRENHWMSMLIIRGTVYLRNGNTYGTKYKTSYCYAECLCHIYDFTC